MMKITLVDETFRMLRDFIYDHSGIYIADNKKYLIENRLERILRENNISSFEEYFHFLKSSKNGKDLARLFDAITTNETYFFREPEQLTVFAEEIFPKLLERNKILQKVRIWSAACSSGEEPYTIAMMLLENKNSRALFDLYASDLSDRVLASGQRAVYSPYAVRNVPEYYLHKYFSSNRNTFALHPSISELVSFRKINLFDQSLCNGMRNMDVIFCRNVLIYFDTKAKQKAVSYLYNCLNHGGYLFIGSSESLHNVTRAFRPIVMNKVIIYQKV